MEAAAWYGLGEVVEIFIKDYGITAPLDVNNLAYPTLGPGSKYSLQWRSNSNDKTAISPATHPEYAILLS